MKRWLLAVVVLLVIFAMPSTAIATDAQQAKESVGKKIFFDTNLSTPKGQSCASCHSPEAAFADPEGEVVSPGALPGRFGNRNAPMATYASYIPAFDFDETKGVYVGGQFWDGRADSLEEQAKGPFLNPLEMNMPNKTSVVARVAASDYADEFEEAFGPE